LEEEEEEKGFAGRDNTPTCLHAREAQEIQTKVCLGKVTSQI
jgi:hypothetical protein